MTDKHPDEAVRVTIEVTRRARDNWSEAAKALGLSQWDMAEVMFMLVDHKSPQVIEMADKIKERNAQAKARKKALTAKLKRLSSEQLEALLRD